MKYILILLYFIYIFTLPLFSQQLPQVPYIRIQFTNNVPPVWHEEAYHPDLVSPVSNGYNSMFANYIKPILHDGFIYSVHDMKPSVDYGFYIEKRAIADGKLAWRVKYNRDDLEKNEGARLMYINAQNQLVLILVREVKEHKLGVDFFWFYDTNCRMVYRVFDTNTGALLERQTPSDSDPEAVVMTSSVNRGTIKPYWFRTPTEGEYIFMEPLTDTNGTPKEFEILRRLRINKYGMPISKTDTVNFGHDQRFVEFMQISYDSLAFLDVGIDKSYMRMKLYNADMDVIKDVGLEKFPSAIGTIALVEADKDYFILWNYQYGLRPSLTVITYAVYNYDGKMIDYVKVPWTYYDATCSCSMLKKYNKFACFAFVDNFVNRVNPAIHYFESDKKGGFVNFREWKIKDSLTAMVTHYIMDAGDDRIILQFMQNRISIDPKYKGYDYEARVQNLMMFEASAFGLAPVGVSDVENDSQNVRLYPNPAQQVITIDVYDAAATEYNLVITDMTGRDILHKSTDGQSSHRIDISNLAAGVYFVSLRDARGRNTATTKLVKVE